MRSIAWIAAGGALVATLAAGPARAQVTGTYDGTIAAKSGPVPIAAVFTEVTGGVTGTVALPGDLATFGGEFLVTGKLTPKRMKISGGGGDGAFLKMNLKIVSGTLRGKSKVKVGGKKLGGRATLTANVSTGDGSGCDAVYQANQPAFDTLMDDVLSICAECHAPGFEAASTRMHVDFTDPLGTARDVALFVDAANPPASKVLAKPLNLIPHGGGAQLTADSPEEMLLEAWVALVTQAQCN